MPFESPIRDAGGFDLIETLRWEPRSGFARLERHLARLHASARELGFEFGSTAIDRALEAVTDPQETRRVRLVLAPGGEASATAAPFEPLAPGTVWRLRLAETTLDETDPLLAHKTTRRAPYEAARAEFARNEADEVVLTNRRGQLCEGTITSLFLDMGDGQLRTPALACGLLPGVLRAELLDEGRAREGVLGAAALASAASIYVGNSLRGLIPAVLAEPHAAMLGSAG